MADLTDEQIDEALERGTSLRTQDTRALTARYDRQLARIVVDLTNGCTFLFPPSLAEGLDRATEEQLSDVEILGAGYGLHWELLDVDLSVPGLLSGRFGTQAHMERLASRARSAA